MCGMLRSRWMADESGVGLFDFGVDTMDEIPDLLAHRLLPPGYRGEDRVDARITPVLHGGRR